MTTKIEPLGGTLQPNLEQDPDWLDLGYGDENGGVITFITISELLYEEWQDAQSEYIDWKEEFKLERVTKPGIYRDDEIYEEGSEKCYTVVVDYCFIAEGMIEQKIEELNEDYGTDFELSKERHEIVELEEEELE